MYARVVTFTGVNDIDGAVRFMQETVLPVLRAQQGYQGASASGDRSSGVFGALSLWESAADRDASESALGKLREEAGRQLGARGTTMETFEERVREVSRPPAVGSRLMLTRISMDPAKIDENLSFFTAQVVPQIKASPGFRALRNMINPQTGEGLVGTVWDDEATMQAAAEAAMARRGEGVARGVSFGDTSYREILFNDAP